MLCWVGETDHACLLLLYCAVSWLKVAYRVSYQERRGCAPRKNVVYYELHCRNASGKEACL